MPSTVSPEDDASLPACVCVCECAGWEPQRRPVSEALTRFQRLFVFFCSPAPSACIACTCLPINNNCRSASSGSSSCGSRAAAAMRNTGGARAGGAAEEEAAGGRALEEVSAFSA
eukprot:1497340-Rhodomonas_salina.1